MNTLLSRLDAIVLAGGQSRRMGQPKALLPWQGLTLVEATVDRLRPSFRRVLVVSKPGFPMPSLPATLVHDAPHLSGPLAGLAAGLAASDASYCFTLGCDMPFVEPRALALMAEHLESVQALALRLEGRVQPLHAFYHRDCLPLAEALLSQGRTSLMALLDHCHPRILDVEALPDAEVCRRSLADLDTPQQYQVALQELRA